MLWTLRPGFGSAEWKNTTFFYSASVYYQCHSHSSTALRGSFFLHDCKDVQIISLSSQLTFLHSSPKLHLFLPFCSFQGEAACKEINAQIYLECSAKCCENIENVFKEATTIALSAMKKAKGHRKRKVCSVLWSGLHQSQVIQIL